MSKKNAVSLIITGNYKVKSVKLPVFQFNFIFKLIFFSFFSGLF